MTPAIAIALTREQVGQVVQQATTEGHLAVEALLPDPEVLVRALRGTTANPNYSSSVIRAVLVLATLPADGSGQELAATAKALSLSTSTVYRYLQTWVALGVVKQERRSRRYARSRELSLP